MERWRHAGWLGGVLAAECEARASVAVISKCRGFGGSAA
jgi:hypothetical protein